MKEEQDGDSTALAATCHDDMELRSMLGGQDNGESQSMMSGTSPSLRGAHVGVVAQAAPTEAEPQDGATVAAERDTSKADIADGKHVKGEVGLVEGEPL